MNSEDRKEPYQRPKLTVIELKAEEVLGVGCKIVGETGPSGALCITITCSTVNVS